MGIRESKSVSSKDGGLNGEKKQATRSLAKDLGVYPAAIRETGSLSPERLLLYVEKI